jgi:hypothetical protein
MIKESRALQTTMTARTTVMTTSYQMQSPVLFPLQELMAVSPAPTQHYPPPCVPPATHQPDTFVPEQIRTGPVGDLLIGGIVGNKFQTQFAEALQNLKTNGVTMPGLKGLGQASLKAGGLSAALSGAVSAFQNIGAVASGKISARNASSNVAADSIGGLMAGTTAGIGAGAASLALGSFGVAGLPLTIAAAAAGALGGLGGVQLYEASGLRDRVFRAAHAFLG